MGSESADVTVELPANGDVSVPVTVACGPAESINGTVSFDLSYPSGGNFTGQFTVFGTVR